MNTPPRKEVERGLYAPVWKKINQMLDYMREISVTGGRGVRVDRKVNGTFLTADIPRVEEGGTGVVKQFLVKAMHDDYLTCREHDGVNETGENVNVAKPFNLRRTGWHGQTVIYTSESYPINPGIITISYTYFEDTYRRASQTVGGVVSVEHQVVRPFWVIDRSLIFASQSENGTGVDGADWQDINADARAWTRAV